MSKTVDNGVKKNGQCWYRVNGKFCNHATYYSAVLEIEASKQEEINVVVAKKKITKCDGSSTTTWVIILGVLTLLFGLLMFGIMAGDAKLSYCGVFKPWKMSPDVIWFVENTCRGLEFTPADRVE